MDSVCRDTRPDSFVHPFNASDVLCNSECIGEWNELILKYFQIDRHPLKRGRQVAFEQDAEYLRLHLANPLTCAHDSWMKGLFCILDHYSWAGMGSVGVGEFISCSRSTGGL